MQLFMTNDHDRFNKDILNGNGFTTFKQTFEIEGYRFAHILNGFFQRVTLAVAPFQHRRKGVVAAICFMFKDDGKMAHLLHGVRFLSATGSFTLDYTRYTDA